MAKELKNIDFFLAESKSNDFKFLIIQEQRRDPEVVIFQRNPIMRGLEGFMTKGVLVKILFLRLRSKLMVLTI